MAFKIFFDFPLTFPLFLCIVNLSIFSTVVGFFYSTTSQGDRCSIIVISRGTESQSACVGRPWPSSKLAWIKKRPRRLSRSPSTPWARRLATRWRFRPKWAAGSRACRASATLTSTATCARPTTSCRRPARFSGARIPADAA